MTKATTTRKPCPDCGGSGTKSYTQHTQICGVADELCDCEPRTWTCPTCRGKGTLDPLAMAIYTARGGPAPTPIMRGFA